MNKFLLIFSYLIATVTLSFSVYEKMEMSMRRLSLSLGMSQSFLSAKKKKHDFSCAEIMALNNYLDTNLFEWFSNRLPANIRPTKKETELLQQVADLQKQILDLEKERDWLKEVVGKK